jgi:soluble lytic murein transglycosylase
VATRAPASDVGRDALARADALLASFPADRRAALATLGREDLFARADALFNAMRHEEAEQAFAEAVSALDPADPERCRARLMQGKALVRRRARDEAAAHMEAVAHDCADDDVRAWALYDAARAHALRGRHDAALTLHLKLAAEIPSHRLADDALFRAALSLEARGDAAGARALLERVATSFPEGDMRGEARFRLAWSARVAARADATNAGAHFARALADLDASLAEGTGEARVDERGRADYWRARTLADLGRSAEAIDAWVGVARRYPLSYYAQQAIARLDESAPERAREVRDAMRDRAPEELVFPLRSELSSDEMARAIELLRVGEVALAMDELEAFGALGEGADPDMLWLSAALLHEAGAYPQASLLVRTRLRTFLDVMPEGRARHFWRMAYPHAFAPLIEDVAAREGVPASLVRAVAREESAFDPRAVSVARAYGLIQLIEPTARRFARELGLPSSPSDLADPEINVPIGTRFLGFLARRYRDNPALVPAAYNAGEGAVDRWIREKHHLRLDELVEEIPYDETRHYTRRVLQTWGTYAWLDEERLPTLPSTVPSGPL